MRRRHPDDDRGHLADDILVEQAGLDRPHHVRGAPPGHAEIDDMRRRLQLLRELGGQSIGILDAFGEG